MTVERVVVEVEVLESNFVVECKVGMEVKMAFESVDCQKMVALAVGAVVVNY